LAQSANFRILTHSASGEQILTLNFQRPSGKWSISCPRTIFVGMVRPIPAPAKMKYQTAAALSPRGVNHATSDEATCSEGCFLNIQDDAWGSSHGVWRIMPKRKQERRHTVEFNSSLYVQRFLLFQHSTRHALCM
jgi:hypothetical protein